MSKLQVFLVLLSFAIGIQILVWSFFFFWRKSVKKGLLLLIAGLLLIFVPVIIVALTVFSHSNPPI
jgi:hypothetical protein